VQADLIARLENIQKDSEKRLALLREHQREVEKLRLLQTDLVGRLERTQLDSEERLTVLRALQGENQELATRLTLAAELTSAVTREPESPSSG
jgi:hypothetical protein